jgi:hypothetical protein
LALVTVVMFMDGVVVIVEFGEVVVFVVVVFSMLPGQSGLQKFGHKFCTKGLTQSAFVTGKLVQDCSLAQLAVVVVVILDAALVVVVIFVGIVVFVAFKVVLVVVVEIIIEADVILVVVIGVVVIGVVETVVALLPDHRILIYRVHQDSNLKYNHQIRFISSNSKELFR